MSPVLLRAKLLETPMPQTDEIEEAAAQAAAECESRPWPLREAPVDSLISESGDIEQTAAANVSRPMIVQLAGTSTCIVVQRVSTTTEKAGPHGAVRRVTSTKTEAIQEVFAQAATNRLSGAVTRATVTLLNSLFEQTEEIETAAALSAAPAAAPAVAPAAAERKSRPLPVGVVAPMPQIRE